jgi:hypothetical protein
MKRSHCLSLSAGALAWLALLSAVLVFYIDKLYSTSIDIGLHGTLVSRLMDSWSIPGSDENLAEMADYPRVAYWLASILGRAAGSAILGMQALAIGATFLLWSMIGIGLCGLVRRQLIAALLVLVLAIVVLRILLGVEVFGDELVTTYFFSHLVSQSLGMAALVLAMRTEWIGKGLVPSYAILGASAPLLASVHLLAAVEILGLLTILVVLSAIVRPPNRTAWSIWSGFGIVTLSTLLTIVNPDFSAMYRLSVNNGAVLLRYASNLRDLLVLVGLVGTISCIMIYLWWRARYSTSDIRLLLLKYFGAFGLATGGLCALQILLYEIFGLASAYACFKYVIALQSSVLIDLAILVTLRMRTGDRSCTAGTKLAFSGALASIACAAVFSGPVALDIRALVAAERETRALVNTGLSNAPDRYNLAIGINDVAPIGNYFISRAVMGAPNLGMTLDVLLGRMPQPQEHISRILTSPRSRPWDFPNCRLQTSTKLVVVDASCAFAAMGTLKCHDTINFSERGAIDNSTTGFPNAGADGRWSEGSGATLTCEVGESPPTVAYINAAGLVDSTHSQRMLVTVNGGPEQIIHYSDSTPSSIVRIALPGGPAATLVFRFSFPNAISPAELGINRDARKLAVMVRSLRFE